MGALWKKRGGLGRHMKDPWQPRAFGITHKGILVYYESKTIQEAEHASDGLRVPRQQLNLKESNAMWSAPEDATDGPTPYLIVIEHDLGQRWKMCAGNEKEFNNWTSTLSSFISKAPDGSMSEPPRERPGGRGLSPPPPRYATSLCNVTVQRRCATSLCNGHYQRIQRVQRIQRMQRICWASGFVRAVDPTHRPNPPTQTTDPGRAPARTLKSVNRP